MRDFVNLAAQMLGIRLGWRGDGVDEFALVESGGDHEGLRPGQVIVRVDPRYFRPTEVETLLGDPTKAKQKLGWSPTTSLQQLVSEMAQSDFVSAKRDSLVKAHGFATFDHHE